MSALDVKQTILALALGVSLSGCFGGCFRGNQQSPTPTTPPPRDPATIDVEIADWPPLGPSGTIAVSAESDDGLNSATLYFAEDVTRLFPAHGDEGTATFNGEELGEGMGTLWIDVSTMRGDISQRQVSDFLVDLSPPVAFLDDTRLRASGDPLRFYIGDAWVVSGYALEVDGKTFTDELDPGYPETLGVDWDYSYVEIPSESIPEGANEATLEVWDAAGNRVIEHFDLVVDGVAPTVGIEGPTAPVSGTFTVHLTGTDDLPGDVTYELRAGGAIVANAAGPSAIVALDAEDLPSGPNVFEATAIDAAGNRSAPASMTIDVTHP